MFAEAHVVEVSTIKFYTVVLMPIKCVNATCGFRQEIMHKLQCRSTLGRVFQSYASWQGWRRSGPTSGDLFDLTMARLNWDVHPSLSDADGHVIEKRFNPLHRW